MTGRERLAVGGALLLATALAFGAGTMFGGQQPATEPAVARLPIERAEARAVYSPQVRDDPWFAERQRENVEALETHCRRTGELCGEARQARLGLED